MATLAQQIDYRTNYYKIKAQFQILQGELQQAKYRQKNYKRQIDIMSQIRDSQYIGITDKQKKMQEQIQKLKQIIDKLTKQKLQLQSINNSNIQKINDLKYHNNQLKNFNQKSSTLHVKQVQMLNKDILSLKRDVQFYQKEQQLYISRKSIDDKQINSQKQKNYLQKQLNQVAEIAKQMEIFYKNQIKKKNQTIKSKQQQINKLNRQLQNAKTVRLTDDRNYINRNDHQMEITQLKGKIKFLINKIQLLEDQNNGKQSIGSFSNPSAEMIQSKMLQSNSSIDSFRFTPNSSLISNRDFPTRRNTSGAKTPSKFQQTRASKHFGPLIQKNY